MATFIIAGILLILAVLLCAASSRPVPPGAQRLLGKLRRLLWVHGHTAHKTENTKS